MPRRSQLRRRVPGPRRSAGEHPAGTALSTPSIRWLPPGYPATRGRGNEHRKSRRADLRGGSSRCRPAPSPQLAWSSAQTGTGGASTSPTVNRKWVPSSGADSTQIRPPWRSTAFRRSRARSRFPVLGAAVQSLERREDLVCVLRVDPDPVVPDPEDDLRRRRPRSVTRISGRRLART